MSGGSNTNLDDVVVVFIPGTPGFIKAYDRFLWILSKELGEKFDIYGRGYVNSGGNYKGKSMKSFSID